MDAPSTDRWAGTPPNIRTRAVHAGRADLRDLGVHSPPLDRSSTYPLSDLASGTEAIDALAAGDRPTTSPVYNRLHNPTVARWEDAIADIEHAEAAVAFASGMAAITATLLAVGAAGHHVVAIRPLYGGTDHLLACGILGAEVSWATADAVDAAIRPDTCLVLLETPANPTLVTADIADVVRQAGDVPVAVDNTFATPILQNPLDFGAAYAIHSATKYLGGHGDVTAGVVATDEERAKSLRQVRIATGAILHPDAAWLLLRSLPTLPMRILQAQQSAQVLAQRLAAHTAVIRVRYPGLADGDPHGLIGRQIRGPGAMIAFDVGDYEAATLVMKAVTLITPAVSLGTTDTLMEHPAGLTHRVVDAAGLDASNISPGLLRLSVGLEDPRDLWADLRGALDLLLANDVAEKRS
jgi:cystathionine beta-lyase/cystathionine gamma-synthase